MNDKIDITELNKIILNSMHNIWYRHAYVQGFDCESITFKKAVNMLERMEIDESIYEGVVETSYKNLPGQMPTILVTSGKREEKLPSH